MPSTASEEKVNKNVLVIGAGLHGLITAKILLHDSNRFFDSITVFEKNSTLGGVWSSNRIYEGLVSNSPLLMYEIPDFKYPIGMRAPGTHVSAQDINRYLWDYTEYYGLTKLIQYQTQVDDVHWNPASSVWTVKGVSAMGDFRGDFGYVVVCTGLYHTSFNPLTVSQTSQYAGNIYHSSETGDPRVQSILANSERVIISGAGKSAVDIATILAKGHWRTKDRKAARVTLVYRRPHWLSPRNMIRGTVPFEKLLFSRFMNAWLPFAKHPDLFHQMIAETRFGRWATRFILNILADDCIKSLNQQDLPQTIPKHSLARALSGAFHVEPLGYMDCVRSGQIEILEGTICGMVGKKVYVRVNGERKDAIESDNVLLGTGYALALPFFSDETIRILGLLAPEDSAKDKTDLPYIRLHRLVVPPGATCKQDVEVTNDKGPYRNIAFNGFASNLLSPTVAYVTAHWISDYFSGAIDLPDQQSIEQGIDHFHAWQTKSFGDRGAKGVHIGPHATLYTDLLLDDMGLRTGHVGGFPGPLQLAREWFRPMFPEIYAAVGPDRRARDERGHVDVTALKRKNLLEDGMHLPRSFMRTSIMAMLSAYILLRVLLPYIAERIPFAE
ncbi:MAG: monooxygenase [Geoglossum umbratile]|nr:MAG: monooxygenase [Geoglossum umbratile]